MECLSVYQATREQILESRRRGWVEWGFHRCLSLEAYIQREETLELLPHAANGKMRVWVLAPRADPTTLEFFSSCETYHREAVVSSSPSPVVAYAIASVCTLERYRRKGYASHLMRLLHFVLADPSLLPPFPVESWGASPVIPPNAKFPYGRAVASALYSEVGPDLYRLCGPGIGPEGRDKAWIVHDLIATIWQVNTAAELDENIEWISASETAAVWDLDAAMIKEKMGGGVSYADATSFSFLPDNDVARFIFERVKFTFSKESDTEKVMWGAKITADSEETQWPYFATWSLDPGRSGPSTLIITRLHASPSTLGKLIAAAKKVAGDLALDQVEVWNLGPELRVAVEELGGSMAKIEDHLPSLAWYAGGNVTWRYNEKFAWI